MWFERFVIIVIGLHRDFLPSSWGYFKPTWVDVCTYIGTFGFIFHLLPVVHAVPADDCDFGSERCDATVRIRIIPLGGAKHEEACAR